MDNPLLMPLVLPPMTGLLALGGCVVGWVLLQRAQRSGPLPELPSGRPVVLALWAALLVLLWLSDYPAAWRLPELVVYLADMSLAAFRILCVTAVGAALFVGVVVVLFSARRR